MVTVELEEKQVFELVKQLTPTQQGELLRLLLSSAWPKWTEGAGYGEERARAAALKRGRDWDRMSESERDQFIDDVLHEDAPR